jgi:hypothetical protein
LAVKAKIGGGASFHPAQVSSIKGNRPIHFLRVRFWERLQALRVRTVIRKRTPLVAIPLKYSTNNPKVWITAIYARVILYDLAPAKRIP